MLTELNNNEKKNIVNNKAGKSSIHMGLISLGRIEWFVIIVELGGGFNPQGLFHVYYFNLPAVWKMNAASEGINEGFFCNALLFTLQNQSASKDKVWKIILSQ